MASNRSQSASSRLVIGELIAWPALLIKISIGPNRARAAAKAAGQRFAQGDIGRGAETSVRRFEFNFRSQCFERGSSCVRACSLWRPCAARDRTMLAPMPRPPPVTSACRPCRGPLPFIRPPAAAAVRSAARSS